MLQEPGRSDYDLQFNLLGFPVRVTWGFWVVAALLGWTWSDYVDRIAIRVEADTPGAFVLLIVWIAGVFLSILVHELGHAFAMRYYGRESRIVLYHFGGLAIDNSFGRWDGARRRHVGSFEQLVISAAGPALQLLLALVTWLIGLQLQIRMEETELVNRWFGLTLGTDRFPNSIVAYAFFGAILFPSIWWALLNLIPVLPLDGGQILSNALSMSSVGQPVRIAQMVSIVVGAVAGFWLLSNNQPGGLMFLLLAVSNWQALQQPFGGY